VHKHPGSSWFAAGAHAHTHGTRVCLTPCPRARRGVCARRFGYFFGGDAESHLKVDLRNSAGFVRHNGACVNNFLLPIRVGPRGRPQSSQSPCACGGRLDTAVQTAYTLTQPVRGQYACQQSRAPGADSQGSGREPGAYGVPGVLPRTADLPWLRHAVHHAAAAARDPCFLLPPAVLRRCCASRGRSRQRSLLLLAPFCVVQMLSITWAQTSPRVEECLQLNRYIQ